MLCFIRIVHILNPAKFKKNWPYLQYFVFYLYVSFSVFYLYWKKRICYESTILQLKRTGCILVYNKSANKYARDCTDIFIVILELYPC